MSDDERSMGRPSNLLDSHTYLKPDTQNSFRAYDLGDSESVVDLSLSDEDRGPSPNGVRGVSPRRSRNRTGTMVHSEALNAAEELSRGFEDATLSRHKASNVARAINVALAEVNAQDQADAVLPPEEEPKETPQSQPEPEQEAESHEDVEIEVQEPSPSIAEASLEELPAPVDTLEIAAPPPAEPGVPPADENGDGEDITEASLDDEPVASEEPRLDPAPQEESKPEPTPEVSLEEDKPGPTSAPSEDVENVTEPEAQPDESTKPETETPAAPDAPDVQEEPKTEEIEAEAKPEVKVEPALEPLIKITPSGMS